MSEDATLDDFIENQPEAKEREVAPPTELTDIPDDWLAVRLDDIALDEEGAFVDGPFGSNLKADEMFDDGYARVVQLQNIRSSDFIDTNHKYISREKFEELKRHGAKPGDLAIAKMSEPVARACLLPEIEDQYIVVADCIKLTVDKSQYNNIFVMLALNSRPVWKQAFARSRGSTRKRINLTQLKEVQIPTPSFEEQRKIASVLYNVDQAIQKTEEIIKQYRRLYSGVAQSMFHDFSDENTKEAGRLGELPLSWEIVSLSDVADVTMGNSPKSKYYNTERKGLPFYQGADEFGERSPTPDRWCSNPKKVGKRRDTLLNIRSHTNVGKVNQAPHECCIGRGLAAITPGEDIDGDFLYHHLRERENYINAIASGSTFDSVNSKEVQSLKIMLPPAEKQEQIALVLNDVQNLILKEKESNNQYDRVKRGLMQDLLSGTVRTTDTNIEVLPEVAQHG